MEIDAPVSSVHELTGAVYYLLQQKKNRAVMFNNVDGGSIPVLTNLFADRMRLALAIGAAEDELNFVYREKESLRIVPEVITAAPVQEVSLDDGSVDLFSLPVVSHNLKDKGPYITAGIMTVKDPDTGVRNSGIYRLMIKDRNHTGIHLAETSHAYYIYRKYMQRKQPMPVAVTIGTHPAVYLSSLSLLGLGEDEFEVAGGLLGEALKLVRCRTVDLEVPAYGEICLEGEIGWNERGPEGPIGEFHSLYSGENNYPVLTVKSISTRKEPIYLDICSGGREHQLMGGLPRTGMIYKAAKKACAGLGDVYLPPSGFCRFSCYLSIKKIAEGEPANAAAAVFGADPIIRHVVVVDDDVNIFDEESVLAAVNRNMSIDDCFIIPRAKGSPIDPVSRNGLVSKIGIDATRSMDSKHSVINYNDSIRELDIEKLFGKNPNL